MSRRVRAAPGEPGEEQQQIVFERVQRRVADLERLGVDRAVGGESRARDDAAVGRDVLVLLADVATEPLDLELARELRDIGRQQQAVLVARQRLEQPGREAPRRAEPGAGRDVGERRDLVLRLGDAHHEKRLADDRMLDLLDALDVLDLRVLEVDAGRERARDRDPHVLVDRRRDRRGAAVVRREIGATTAERDAQWATSDQHGLGSLMPTLIPTFMGAPRAARCCSADTRASCRCLRGSSASVPSRARGCACSPAG